MASDADNSEDGTEAAHGPRECMPCRGSGQVISNLGGSPSSVSCPWCGGSGLRVPGTDAQAGWPTEAEGDAPDAPRADGATPTEDEAATPDAPRAEGATPDDAAA